MTGPVVLFGETQPFGTSKYSAPAGFRRPNWIDSYLREWGYIVGGSRGIDPEISTQLLMEVPGDGAGPAESGYSAVAALRAARQRECGPGELGPAPAFCSDPFLSDQAPLSTPRPRRTTRFWEQRQCASAWQDVATYRGGDQVRLGSDKLLGIAFNTGMEDMRSLMGFDPAAGAADEGDEPEILLG